MLRYVRWAVTVLVVPSVLVVLGALFQTQIERVASGRQFDLFSTRWLLKLSESTHYLFGVEGFWFVFGFLGGAAAVLWMVEWFFKEGSS